jgi:hypothetical protein
VTAAARLLAQGLGDERPRDAHDAVAGALAIQAQDTRAARLGVRARSEGVTVADVVRACSEDRSLVRTWAVRGTLHMVAAEDVRWLLALTGPTTIRRDARRRAQVGLDDDLCARALAAVPGLLAGGPLTRGELVDGLRARGVAVPADGQAPAHLLLLAAAGGLVCRGPDRADERPTYVLLDDWLGPGRPVDQDAALAELARRYRSAYGPSDVRDLAHWSGLPAAEARRAWKLAGPPPPRPREAPLPCRLLPAFDGVLLGHRDRTPLLADRHAALVSVGGIIRPTAIAGARVVATWRLERRSDEVVVHLAPFGRLPRGARAGLRAEAEDVGRFLGRRARTEVAAAR